MSPLDAIKKNGFFIARSLIPSADIESLLKSIGKTFYDQLGKSFNENYSLREQFLDLHSKDEERYKKVLGSLWRKLECYKITHHSNILSFLEKELGWHDIFIPGGQVVHVMSETLKIKNGYFGFAPHQDFPSVQGSLDGLICWIPLVKVTNNNYPIEVIPGSHLDGLRKSSPNSAGIWEVHVSPEEEKKFTALEANVGDAIFISAFTVHRSSVIGGNNFRIAVSTRFDNGDEPSFIARNYPSAYIRTVHRDQFINDFPTNEQIKGVFC